MKYYESENGFDLEEALRLYREMNEELGPAIEAMNALKREIQRHALETGEVAEVEGASVSIRSGYVRKSWDGRALEGFAAVHPEILQFRKEREIGPSAVVKVTS